MMRLLFLPLILFFCLGTVILPNSDFTALKELPKMYHHCKAAEDKDMTFIDFITDHLVNIDAIFDKHDKGDQQKPHKYNFHNQIHFQICSPIQKIEFENPNLTVFITNDFNFYQSPISDCYKNTLLRPPISA